MADVDLSAWRNWGPADCAEFAARATGLYQYGDALRRNLKGAHLVGLRAGHLARAGIHNYQHQRDIVECYRLLQSEEGRCQLRRVLNNAPRFARPQVFG